MRKSNLAALALFGITSLTLPCSGYSAADEKTFYEQLTPDAQRKFNELDNKHKQAAMQVIEIGCRANGQCKGHRERAVEEQYKNQMNERTQATSQLH